MSEFTLSVVDQSPMRMGGTAAEALQESVALAKAVEEFGYERYWVTEHHSSQSVAGTAPEILIGQIAANTQRIHVGSAGVMLTHYSALKVAEVFRLLSAFYPGRVDLGLGRAPGSDRRTAVALAYPRQPAPVDEFPRQVTDLLGFLHGTQAAQDPSTNPGQGSMAGISAQPGTVAPEILPEVWLLGSSDYSAQLAASLGLPFAFADFFGYAGGQGPQVAEIYRSLFRPSAYLQEPKFNVTLQVVCAETDERARYLGSSKRLQVARTRTGERRQGLESPEEAFPLVQHPELGPTIMAYTSHFIEGGPETVRQGIMDAGERYGTQDIGMVSYCYDFADRANSYRLVAERFGLTAGE